MIDRRSVCLGTAAAMVGASTRAAPDTPFFVSGPFSHDLLAAGFRTPGAPLTLPSTPLVSAHGPQRLSRLRGRTHLVSLWAEWCSPCLQEATDLAAISRTYGGPSFGVIFVLTSSHKKLDLAGAQAVLARRGAGDVTLFVEPDGRESVFQALAKQELSDGAKTDMVASLPCNLLVDRHGQVRARSFGAPSAVTYVKGSRPDLAPHTLTDAEKARALNEHTMWATQSGHDFAAALAAGLLEKA
ncbi:MAG TPA: TlpA disulfide reductase family protein [Phenylobacterium sp.]|jgi:thiol-disulfide isomerase/thioredoxin|uniref:TlpA family protein disulfide reductase n=1 Tax=Phenylobacterium sp. TaxID=1871053 RepID=UPI002D4C65F9|nr:TlpA disulfide reductase family protein [Phenylobacterium sp.]HZZ69925.1 TlpA disulfide reductase family protein [Phenylobacterium sp.]